MKQRLLRTALMLVLIFCSSAAWAEKQMYSKLTGSTLTVYYDENKTETDYSWPVAFATRGNFTNVIFDNSFAVPPNIAKIKQRNNVRYSGFLSPFSIIF